MTYHHFYQEGNPTRPVFLLLHGTGGTEKDLIPLAKMIDENASILSVRGNVSENGMNRYFRRLSEGVFDLEDLEKRTHELAAFITEAATEYHFKPDQIVVLGYSNGANIAASMLYFFKDIFQGALLHHPMVPFRDREMMAQEGLPIFVGAGVNDPICPPDETKDLIKRLEQAKSKVTTYWGTAGHSLTQEELQAAKSWYEEQFGI